jgi:MFS family permease
MANSRNFLLQYPDFTLFWSGTFLVNIAVQIQTIAVGWQVYQLARETMSIAESAFLMGLVGLSEFLPLFCLSLFAGTLADRASRKWITVFSLIGQWVSVLGLMILAFSNDPSFMHIFIMVGIFGAARAFLAPAATSLVPMLVPRAVMHKAIALKSLAWQMATILGPWVGGLIIAVGSAGLALSASAILLGLGIVLISLLRSPTKPERATGSQWHQIREGLAFVWGNKIILGAISLDLFAVLLGGATALLPAFAADILQVGPQGFGLLRSGPAIGAVVVAIVLARWPLARQAGRRMLMAVAVFGLATLVFGLSRNLYLSVAALAVLGAADMISVYVRQTLVQVVTPDHMRGRVSSVSGLFISGSNELGEFESGLVSRFIGPVGAVIFGGIGTLVVTGLWAKWFPDLRRADRLDGQGPS